MKLAVWLIALYQRVKHTLGLPSSCRFTPSCSEYMKLALRRHGIIRGFMMGIKRVTRCNPWNPGGYDPVT